MIQIIRIEPVLLTDEFIKASIDDINTSLNIMSHNPINKDPNKWALNQCEYFIFITNEHIFIGYIEVSEGAYMESSPTYAYWDGAAKSLYLCVDLYTKYDWVNVFYEQISSIPDGMIAASECVQYIAAGQLNSKSTNVNRNLNRFNELNYTYGYRNKND